MKNNKIYRIIDQYNVISFDIFDTLIKRDIVNPEDVFEILQKKLNNLNIKISEYKKKRLLAENVARANSISEEITLDKIYDCFAEKNKNLKFEIIKKIKELEEETEIELSILNLNIAPIFEYCKENNKSIILTSDMYLGKAIIEKILQKNNIYQGRDYSKLYLSSEVGVTKKSGNLYRYIIKDLNISKKELIHIGDAMKSDYLVPVKMGIKAYHIKTIMNNSSYDYLKTKDRFRKNKELLLDKFISNRLLKIDNKYEKFGYECIGPLLYGFSEWLYTKVNNNNYSRVNFLAREGLFLKKAFEIVYPEIKTRYVCVSRKSIIGAMLCSTDSIEQRLKMIKIPHAFDKNVILDLLGLGSEDFKLEDNKIYYSIEDVINDRDFYSFLVDIDKKIVDKSFYQIKYLKEYLEFENENENICIVDVGWNGTMQYYLNNLLISNNYNKKIQGYYVGVSKASKNKYENLDSNGYLFDVINNNDQIDENKLFAFCGLFESIFTADHGSVKEYRQGINGIEPVFYEYEYEDNYKIISKIQKGALEFLKDYKKSLVKENLDMDVNLISSKLLKLGNYPQKKHLKMFNELDFFDIKRTKMIGESKLFKNNLKDIKNEFLMSGWKVGFLKRQLYVFPASKFYCNYRENKIRR